MGLFAIAFNLLMGYGAWSRSGTPPSSARGLRRGLLVKKAGPPLLWPFWPRRSWPPPARCSSASSRPAHATSTSRCSRWRSPRSSSPSIFKWNSLTGGDNGLLDVRPPDAAQAAAAFYYFTLAVVGAGHRASARHRQFAVRLRPAGHPREPAAGVHRHPRSAHQLLAFVISGAFSGLAGGLFALFNGSVFPDFAFLTKSFEPLVVALLGGVQSSSARRWPGPSASSPRVVIAVSGRVLAPVPRRHLAPLIVFLPRGFMGLVGAARGGGARSAEA